MYLENKDGKFIIHELPAEAQLSSINKILVKDYDKDGALDALIVGNLFTSEVETPRNDAGYDLFLKGKNNGSFISNQASESGFFAHGDIKDMNIITVENQAYIILAINNDNLKFVKIKK